MTTRYIAYELVQLESRSLLNIPAPGMEVVPYADHCRAVEDIANRVRKHGCQCPHSAFGSSEEWDRKHAGYCPVSIAAAIRQEAT
jgi:5-methylcytosine-specific restriction endonuclease McrA